MKNHKQRRNSARSHSWVRDQTIAAISVADIGKGQTLDDLTGQDFDRVTAERRKATT
jgi:hypothetical protein